MDDITCPRADSCWIDVVSGGFIVRYQHVTDYSHLKPGSQVVRGDFVASLYDAGDNTHLHFEIRNADESIIINPVLMLHGDYTHQLATNARQNARRGYTGVTCQYSDSGELQVAYLDPFNTMSIQHGAGTFQPSQAMYLNTFPYLQGW